MDWLTALILSAVVAMVTAGLASDHVGAETFKACTLHGEAKLPNGTKISCEVMRETR